jgi:hypothetical protein
LNNVLFITKKNVFFCWLGLEFITICLLFLYNFCHSAKKTNRCARRLFFDILNIASELSVIVLGPFLNQAYSAKNNSTRCCFIRISGQFGWWGCTNCTHLTVQGKAIAQVRIGVQWQIQVQVAHMW